MPSLSSTVVKGSCRLIFSSLEWLEAGAEEVSFACRGIRGHKLKLGYRMNFQLFLLWHFVLTPSFPIVYGWLGLPPHLTGASPLVCHKLFLLSAPVEWNKSIHAKQWCPVFWYCAEIGASLLLYVVWSSWVSILSMDHCAEMTTWISKWIAWKQTVLFSF